MVTLVERSSVPVSQCYISPLHRRAACDWGDLDALSRSMKEHGQISRLTVRHNPAPGGALYEIGVGTRRWRAAPGAGLAELLVDVVEADDASFVALQLEENDPTLRCPLHPCAIAELYGLLFDAGFTLAQVAERHHVDKRVVAERLRLRELAPAVKLAYTEGKFDAAIADFAAAQLAKLPASMQERAAKAMEHVHDERGVLQVLRSHFVLPLARAPWDLVDPHLVPKAGACLPDCPKRSLAQRDMWSHLYRATKADKDEPLKAEKTDDFCTDKACWGEKSEAHWQQQAVDAPRHGIQVVSGKAAADLFDDLGDAMKRPALKPGSGYVECSATAIGAAGDGQKSYFEVLGLQPDVLARDPTGMPRRLYADKTVRGVLRKEKRKEPKAEGASAEAPKPSPAQTKKLEAERVALIAACAERATKVSGQVIFAALVTPLLADDATASAVAARRGMKDGAEQLRKRVAKTKDPDLAREVLVELLVTNMEHEEVAAVAKALGVDVAKVKAASAS